MMKILFTSDLHIGYENSDSIKLLKEKVKKELADVLVVSGDIYDYRGIDPFKEFVQFGIPVVFCLGNHEFAYRSVEETINLYATLQMRYLDKQIYCLDVLNDGIVIDGVKFVGNVLWYDGSLSDRNDTQYWLDNIIMNWLDHTIKGFNPVTEHQKCVDMIVNSLKDWKGDSVLVTHCVPHWKLNLFSYDTPNGIYNIYSGVKDLFSAHDIYPTYALCGHTHRKTNLEYHNGDKTVFCINVGNDYFERNYELKYTTFSLGAE